MGIQPSDPRSRFPLRAEVTACRRCGSAVLRDLPTGRDCIMCGIVHFVRDGDWLGETHRRPGDGLEFGLTAKRNGRQKAMSRSGE